MDLSDGDAHQHAEADRREVNPVEMAVVKSWQARLVGQ
jgi:hypothetical protein